jgi:nitroimidazol reductase NimA-like FMN-containing flavoprotein (pyridoxamine 5'-phosphate oxidase superfamily)
MTVAFSSKEKSFVESQRVMRFNSLTPDGRIHSVPICYAFDGANLYAHANSKETRRWRNIMRNETASIEIDYYSDDWSLLKGILIDVKPSFVDAGPDQKKALSLLRNKYKQYQTMLGNSTPIVKMEPVHVVSWGLD